VIWRGRRETGEVAPRRQPRGRLPVWRTHGEPIRQAVKEAHDATLAELRRRLSLAVALPTLWRALAALGLSREKTPVHLSLHVAIPYS
jgi:hypothetical protein